MNNNIVIISDDIQIAELIKSKVNLRRFCDKPVCFSVKQAKKDLSNKNYSVLIIDENSVTVDKILSMTKNLNVEILVFSSKIDYEKYKDYDIFGFVSEDSTSDDLGKTLLNCFKILNCKKQLAQNKMYLENVGIFNGKTESYNLKYLKEIFDDIPKKNHALLCIISLDDKVKTKVSTNRLAGIIKKSLRFNDILAQNNNGYFYILFENMSIQNAVSFIENIQSKIGNDLHIRAGLEKVGFQDFDEAEKNAQDSLQMAIKNEKIYESITSNNSEDIWLDTDHIEDNKQFKLFNKVYENKLKNIIEPVFFRFKKECGSKFDIIQYVNNIESAFSFKQDNDRSELILHYDGFTKINAELNHSGLYSVENSKFSIALNKFDEKELIKLLKRLKQEFIKSRG